MPDVVPFLDLPGRVPTEGGRFSGAPPAGPVRRLCPRVLLGLQGQLAPWAGLPGKQPAHYLLPTRRKQVPPFCALIPLRSKVMVSFKCLFSQFLSHLVLIIRSHVLIHT